MASSANKMRVAVFQKSPMFRNFLPLKRHIFTTGIMSAMPNIAPDHVYLDKPQYPEIRDNSVEGRKRHARFDWYDEIKKMPSVMDKTLCFVDKRCLSYIFEGCVNRYGSMEHIQHTTKTHVIQGLPETYYNSLNIEPWLEILREPFLDTIACESYKVSWRYPEWKTRNEVEKVNSFKFKPVLGAVMHLLSSTLASGCDHLLDSQITEDARCDAFWWRGNDMTDPNNHTKLKPKTHVPRFQLRWNPDFQIRTQNPLPPIFDRDDPLCASNDVPYSPYHPVIWRYYTEAKKYSSWAPGFWPGDTCEFPFLTMTSPTFFENWTRNYGALDTRECLDTAALVCMYGWLLASAMMQGFTSFNELTYPLVGQLVFTDGKQWTFYTYQLNTVLLHPDVDAKTHRNLCWTSGPMNLYETIEDGQLKGFNEEVLSNLVKFFLTPAPVPIGLDLKPYLNEESLSQEEKNEKLKLMRDNVSNKIDYKIHRDEIPTWHHVYKYNPKAKPCPVVKLW